MTYETIEPDTQHCRIEPYRLPKPDDRDTKYGDQVLWVALGVAVHPPYALFHETLHDVLQLPQVLLCFQKC